MLTYHRTSILTSQAQTVVNTVNTGGVMGKGIASEFKARYPDMFKAYRKLCKERQFEIGQLWLWKATDQWVLNFPTKKHWRHPSKLSYLDAGLKKLVDQYETRGIREIAFPRLGCGHGGLDWADVRPLMERYLSQLPIPVYIHDYEVDIGVPEHRQISSNGDFRRSFSCFIEDLHSVLKSKHGTFQTISNKTKYTASLNSDKNLLINRPGRNIIIQNDELYELWTLLLRGPVTRRRLPGEVRESAYYIFPILAALPYVRAVEIGLRDDTSSTAVELIDRTAERQVFPSKAKRSGQGKFEWV